MRVQQSLTDVGLAEPLQHDHVRLHPALAPYLSGELTPEQHATAVSAWSEAMFQLTSHLYQQRQKEPKTAAELTLLELSNLLAALEHRFATVESRLSFGTKSAEPEANDAVAEQAATDLESIIGMTTRLETLLQHLGRPHALRSTESIRVQAAARLQALRGDHAWSHAQFNAHRSAIERLLECGHLAEAVDAARRLLIRSREAGESAYSGADYDLAMAHVSLGRVLNWASSAQTALEPLAEARTRFEQLGQSGDADAARMASVSLTDYADRLRRLLGQFGPPGRGRDRVPANDRRIGITRRCSQRRWCQRPARHRASVRAEVCRSPRRLGRSPPDVRATR